MGVANLIQSIAENLKIHTLTFRWCRIRINDEEQSEHKIILGVLKQNCSLTKLDLEEGNEYIDADFLNLVDVELKKNKQIV